ncbi:hypothetical protein LHU53_19300 [Rhodoferax sp. U2-2l]|uniref:hypothetical protein n=1 Tax=Rhodoferax sp. U2-2l TaxID=2884000 RepID=UPI001D0A1DBB|nr:hypothetical protein [Rhodoferax sp. U2-2l]MCB8749039.1 hypothetical protein [Rhodoferax sp. U2-2l]
MFDELATYYHDNVVEAFVAYRDTSRDGLAGRGRDLREAIVAASALFHLREHLPNVIALSRLKAEKLCTDYALLGDIVNAAKHKSITQPTPHGAPLVNNVGKLKELLLNIEYEDTEGVYRCTKKTVVATLVDGTERNLLEVLTNVMNFWESHLYRLGVFSKQRTFVFEPPVRYRTRSECEQIRLDHQVVQGQRYQPAYQFLRFDTRTGQARPIDLTGCKLDMRIYKPRFNFNVSLKLGMRLGIPY